MSGTSLLGFGFNVFGTLDLEAGVTQAIIVADGNIVTSPPSQPTITNSNVFTSREEVTNHFAASVEIKASGFGFDGEFSAKYGNESSSTADCVYGLYSMLSPVSITNLADLGSDNYATPFASDPDVLDIPTEFNAANAEAFYRLFRRYGTHIVSEITLGGRLNAYTTSTTTASTNEESAEASVKLEYEAMFASASAQAATDWKSITSDYEQNREMTYETMGGDPAALVGFVPEANTSENSAIATWLASVPANAAVIDYKVQRLSVLFNGTIGAEVEKAYRAYMGAMIRVDAYAYLRPRPVGGDEYVSPLASTITVPGLPLIEQPAYTSGAVPTTRATFQCLWLILLDPANLATAPLGPQGKGYFIADPVAQAQVNTDIKAALAAIPEPLVIAVIEGDQYAAGIDPPTGMHIPEQLQALLELCGGFDLQGEYMTNDTFGAYRILSIIGLAGDPDSPVVTEAVNEAGVAEAGTVYNSDHPARAVVQFLDNDLTVVSQYGGIVSPVGA